MAGNEFFLSEQVKLEKMRDNQVVRNGIYPLAADIVVMIRPGQVKN